VPSYAVQYKKTEFLIFCVARRSASTISGGCARGPVGEPVSASGTPSLPCPYWIEFVHVDQTVPQPDLPSLFDHGPDLAGSCTVVNFIDQLLAQSPVEVLPQIWPSPEAPVAGPPEAVGAPTLLPDSTHSLSGLSAPSIASLSLPCTTQSPQSLAFDLAGSSSTLTEFVPVDQPVPQPGMPPIYYHGSAQNWPCPVFNTY